MIFFILFISVFYVVGFWLLGKGIRDYSRGQRSLSWPQVEGHIEYCEIVEDNDSDGTTWKVKLRYGYSVNGRDYEGDQIAFGYTGSSTYEEHKAIYNKLTSSNKLYVNYDPGNPVVSIVAAGFNRSTFLTLVFAVTWLLFVIGFTVLWTGSSGQDNQILNQINMIHEP